MSCKKILHILNILLLLIISPALAENIDPNDDGSQYAYGENIGWFNFEPNQGTGVQVSSSDVTGYVWAENIGWINLSPLTYGGVVNDGTGNLSGYAWGENVGWINFDPNNGDVTIDSNGNFTGWAWGENIGWINFNSAQLFDKGVQVCKVHFIDLANFVDDWLASSIVPANLDGEGPVDFKDYSIFASYWLCYCPPDWPLK